MVDNQADGVERISDLMRHLGRELTRDLQRLHPLSRLFEFLQILAHSIKRDHELADLILPPFIQLELELALSDQRRRPGQLIDRRGETPGKKDRNHHAEKEKPAGDEQADELGLAQEQKRFIQRHLDSGETERELLIEQREGDKEVGLSSPLPNVGVDFIMS